MKQEQSSYGEVRAAAVAALQLTGVELIGAQPPEGIPPFADALSPEPVGPVGTDRPAAPGLGSLLAEAFSAEPDGRRRVHLKGEQDENESMADRVRDFGNSSSRDMAPIAYVRELPPDKLALVARGLRNDELIELIGASTDPHHTDGLVEGIARDLLDRYRRIAALVESEAGPQAEPTDVLPQRVPGASLASPTKLSPADLEKLEATIATRRRLTMAAPLVGAASARVRAPRVGIALPLNTKYASVAYRSAAPHLAAE